MKFDPIWVASILALIVVGYTLATRGLFRTTEYIRMEMIDLAVPLLKCNEVSDCKKRRIGRMLDDVHSPRAAWRLVLTMAIFLIVSLFRSKTELKSSGMPPRFTGQYKDLQLWWLLATLSNSLAASVLFTFITIVHYAFDAKIKPLAATLSMRIEARTGA